MKEIVAHFVKNALQLSFDPAIEVPAVKEFGHYTTNIAMRLASGEQAYKDDKKNPFVLAQEFVKTLLLAKGEELFLNIKAVQPGFINFTLAPSFLQKKLLAISKDKKFGTSALGKGKRVIVEYSSPNIAKPMHVGHLRSTIIGDALANMYAAQGYKVIRWNYLGDWGTQFGKLIAAYKTWGDKKSVEQKPIETLLALYVQFHEALKVRPELEQMGQEEFKKLEEGDRANRQLWIWFKKESLKEFSKIYKRLGVTFDVAISESFYEKKLKGLVKALLLLKGGVEKGEEGSLIFPLGQFNLPPALVQKSDGASLYLTRDIATLKDRLKKYKPTQILYVVANEQALHFEQLFAISKVLGLTKAELSHIKFGLVLGPDGKKLSTREGKTVQLEEVLNKAVARAYDTVKAKNPDLSEKEMQRVAEIVGVGAVKYNDLKENRQSDIIFNCDRMLDATGDSAPYLQYAYARLMSILRKAQGAKSKWQKADVSLLTHELELAMIKKILDLPDVIALAVTSNLTSHLAKYLFELAKLASYYYETTPILKDENMARRNARLMLISVIALTLQRG